MHLRDGEAHQGRVGGKAREEAGKAHGPALHTARRRKLSHGWSSASHADMRLLGLTARSDWTKATAFAESARHAPISEVGYTPART